MIAFIRLNTEEAKEAPLDLLSTGPCTQSSNDIEIKVKSWTQSLATAEEEKHDYICLNMKRIVPDSTINNWAPMMDGCHKKKKTLRGYVRSGNGKGNVLSGICATGCGTAAWAQDKGSCPKCLTSLIGDILDRTSGNSGVSVTTSVDWPVGC